MQALSVVLLLISVGCIVGPIAGVVIMYKDNLSHLVSPSQINNLLNSAQTSNNNNNPNNNIGSGNFGVGTNNNNGNGNDNSGGGLINPVFVGAQINNEAKTFTATVNVTNNFGYDLTVNSINATVESSQDNYPLGTISLTNPVTILAGQTTPLTISGAWTQDAENHVLNNDGGTSSIDVNLVNTTIDVNGIVIQETQPINVGNVPLT